MSGSPPSSTKRRSLRQQWNRLQSFCRHGLWQIQPQLLSRQRRWLLRGMRILFLAFNGMRENRLISKAAALSYASLMALGPTVAIIVMVSSAFVDTDPGSQIKRGLLFIAPSLQEYGDLEQSSSQAANEEMASALDSLLNQIVEGANSLIEQVNTGGSRTFSVLGGAILIWIVIQLLTTVETTLNQIWGVRKGRPYGQRIVYYWSFVSLGAVLGLGSTALLSASNVAVLSGYMPFGSSLAPILLGMSPLLSFAMLVALLVLFYRFFPNTNVAFKPALIGSLLTALLLLLNNYLSILYVHRVLSFQSLYGSVGIIPVLMIGLFFFWILILFGGQLTCSAQSVDLQTGTRAWTGLSRESRELLTLAVFLQIARAFHRCQPAPSADQLTQQLQIPLPVLNESIESLESMHWIVRVTSESPSENNQSAGFRPACPLASLSMASFRRTFSELGHAGHARSLLQNDPLLRHYHQHILHPHEQMETDAADSLEDLLQREQAPAQP